MQNTLKKNQKGPEMYGITTGIAKTRPIRTIRPTILHDAWPSDLRKSACAIRSLAVAWPDGPAVVVEGRVDGTLSFPGRGTRGFGYDPIFVPEGHAETFGEMDPAAKDRMSHRARAFEKLKAALL